MDRRTFLKIAGAGAALAAIPWRFDLKNGLRANAAWAFAQSPGLTKFADPLPGLGPTGIPVAVADKVKKNQPALGYDHYSIDIGQFNQVLHSDFVTKGQTRLHFPQLGGHHPVGLWSERQLQALGRRHRGAKRSARADYLHQPAGDNSHSLHPLPVDVSPASFPDATPSNRTAVHLHGGLVPWISDGGPYDWFDPLGNHGPSFLNNQVLNPKAKKGQAEYYYPNDQSARLLWYHDHAHDLTRLNAYAGVASGYLIIDTVEQADQQRHPAHPCRRPMSYGVPLITQDKIFVPPNIDTIDPTWQHVVRLIPGPGQPLVRPCL